MRDILHWFGLHWWTYYTKTLHRLVKRPDCPFIEHAERECLICHKTQRHMPDLHHPPYWKDIEPEVYP